MCQMSRGLYSSNLALPSAFNFPPDTTNLRLVNRTDLRLLRAESRTHRPIEHHLRARNSIYQQFWQLNNTTRRSEHPQDIIIESQEIITANNNGSISNDDSIRYLDFELLNEIIKWLRARGVLSLVAHAAKELKSFMLILTTSSMNRSVFNQFVESEYWRQNNLESRIWENWTWNAQDRNNNNINDNNDQNDDQETPLPSESETIKLKLLESLKINRLINSFLLACHIILYMTCLDSFSPLIRDLSEIFGPSSDVESVQESTSCKHHSYYLFAITLLDLIGSVGWYYCRDRYKVSVTGSQRSFTFSENKEVSWLKWIPLISTSPRHTYQLFYSIILIILGPFAGTRGLLVGLFNVLGQSIAYIYNIYRIGCYIKQIEVGCQHPVTADSLNSNDLLDRRTGQICQLRLSRNQGGWSNWPVELSACDCKFTESFRYRFEHSLVLVQIVGVKLIIFTLLFYMDTLVSNDKFEKFLSFCCMIEAFLASHFYYDKYLARYMMMDKRGYLVTV